MKSLWIHIIPALFCLITSCSEERVISAYKNYNEYAEFFRIDGDKLTIYQPNGSDSIEFWRRQIHTQRIALQSTTQLTFLKQFASPKSVRALPYLNYICDPHIAVRVDNGLVRELFSGDAMNVEFLVVDDIQLLLLGDYTSFKHPKVVQARDFGVKTLPILDWKELHPLARTEWIKVFGWMYGKDKEADSIYNSIAGRYHNLKDSIVYNIAYKERPAVFSGVSHKDNWFMPGGKSYLAQLIRDAGGNYLFKENKDHASFQMSFETFYKSLFDAEYWIASVNTKSMHELVARDLRVDKMPVVKSGKVFGNGKQLCDRGGNLYWSDGILMPDKILRDLYEIFHGNENHTYFYQKLR